VTSVSERRRNPPRSFVRLPDHLAAIHVERSREARPLTREQAAALLGIHPRTLDRWARLERIRVIDLGGTVRIRVDEAQRLLRDGRSRST
jgi:excisionase family DNA binding protein